MAFTQKSFALIPFLMLLWGCSGTDNFDLVVIDTTSADCTCVLDQVVAETLGKLGTTSLDKHSLNGHKIRVVQVNDQRSGVVYEDSLPVVMNYLSLRPKQRVSAQKNYLNEKIPRMIRAACAPPSDSMMQTWLYQPAFENIGDLVRSGVANKSVTLYSDMLENGAVSFYSVETRRTPVLLMVKKDSLIREIDMHYGPPPDMRGLSIRLRHSPSLRDQDLHQYSRRFADTLFTRRGADFTIERMIECDFESPTQDENKTPVKPSPAPPITDNTITI